MKLNRHIAAVQTSIALGMTVAALTGCASTPAGGLDRDAFGRTYYIDGAGNWGYGVAEMQNGLRHAGYRGSIINYRWSPTLNPALDQTIGRPVARACGKALGREITAYLRQYPGREVNIIALSAGTGVAVWACENLTPPAKVNNLILLGSSIACDYDMHAALANIRGGVWVYYSHHDQILLGPVRTLGTIDGKHGTDGAGLVGLQSTGGTDKIHNVAWSSKFARYGWTGGHTDSTSQPFVELVLAPQHIVTAASAQAAQPAPAQVALVEHAEQASSSQTPTMGTHHD